MKNTLTRALKSLSMNARFPVPLKASLLVLIGLGVVSASALSAQVTLDALGDAYVKDGASAGSNTGSSTVLEVAARGTGNDRKIYLSFDVSTLPYSSYSGSSLSLTLSSLLGTADGNVSISFYAITDSTPTFDQSTITWNNAPKNITDNFIEFSDVGTTELGSVNIDTTSSTINGTVVTLQGAAFDTFLDWATGNLGDYYGTGATSATDGKITIMISMTAISTPYEPGFRFYSSEGATVDFAGPQLTAIPEPSASSYGLVALALGLVLYLRRKK